MKLPTLLLAGGTLMASPALAQNISLNFDDQYAGSDISTAYTAQGVTFSSTNATGAAYTDFLPGTDTSDPNANRGIDASSDFVAGAVTVSLLSGLSGTAFSVNLIGSPNGYGSDNFVSFFDAANTLIGQVGVNTNTTQFVSYTPSAPFTSVVLPADAYYDNLTIAAAPEPSVGVALAIGGLGIGLLARRRRA